MMQLLELLERIGTTETNLVSAYVKDAFNEVQGLSRENKIEGYISIVSGIEDYNLPTNMVKLVSLVVNDNGEQNYNDYEWRWANMGRTVKLYKLNTENEWSASDISVTNGIELEYTVKGYVFVKNPEGDSSYYTYTTAQTSGVSVNEIVYVADGVRADYATRYHYYKRLVSSLSSTDLSGVDYTDTTYWEDVTEITSPDEYAYINCGNDLLFMVEQYVRAKLADRGNDVQLYEYRNIRARKELEKTIKNRMTEVRVKPPRYPFKLT